LLIALNSFFVLRDTSVWPYFAIMGLFLFEAALIQRTIPFFRRALAQEQVDKSHFMQLDGLRGLLALGVFFTHAESFRQQWITGKWLLPDSNFYSQLAVAPVAMFFLITGFLFWTKALKAKRENWATFFFHRIRRLVPAYLFALLLIVLVVAVSTGFQIRVPVSDIAKNLLKYLTFNLIPAGPLNGFQHTGDIYANVFWSLRVEWMFYLLFPFMSLLARTRRKQLILLSIAVALYFFLPLLHRSADPNGGANGSSLGVGTLQYFIFYLVSYFSIGMAAAYLKKSYKLAFLTGTPATVIGIATALAIAFILPPAKGLLEGIMLGIPFVAVVFGNSFFGLLRLRPLVLLGQISYSTYVLHAIVLYSGNQLLARTINPGTLNPIQFWLFTAALGVLVVLLSAFSYRWFEAPFMKVATQPVKLAVATR
jgi:peptidoglycan/LPS O-acetylase OafA/YrhL